MLLRCTTEIMPFIQLHCVYICVSGFMRCPKGCYWDRHFVCRCCCCYLREKKCNLFILSTTKHIFFLEHANVYCVMINGYWVSVLTFERNWDTDIIYWRFFQHIFHVLFLLKQIAISSLQCFFFSFSKTCRSLKLIINI